MSLPTRIASGRQLVRLGDLVDQPPVRAPRWTMIELAGQEQLPGPAVADQPGQVVHDDRGNQAAKHLGIADPGRLGGDREVARRHQPGAAGQGIAVDRRDRRLGQRVQLLDQVGILLQGGHGMLFRLGHRLAPRRLPSGPCPSRRPCPPRSARPLAPWDRDRLGRADPRVPSSGPGKARCADRDGSA